MSKQKFPAGSLTSRLAVETMRDLEGQENYPMVGIAYQTMTQDSNRRSVSPRILKKKVEEVRKTKEGYLTLKNLEDRVNYFYVSTVY